MMIINSIFVLNNEELSDCSSIDRGGSRSKIIAAVAKRFVYSVTKLAQILSAEVLWQRHQTLQGVGRSAAAAQNTVRCKCNQQPVEGAFDM